MAVRWLANTITMCRIAAAASLLFTAPLSTPFCLLYTAGGVTDIADGAVARKTHTESRAGAHLDSAADLIFLAAVCIKLFPVLIARLPSWIVWFAGLAAVVRCLAYGAGALKYRRFAPLHTLANKITGAAVFCIPYLLAGPAAAAVCTACCILAAGSALEELLIHIRSGRYDPDVRSIFRLSPASGGK